MVRHSREKEIIDIALSNLTQSEMGSELTEFARDYDVKISVLRGTENRDYVTGAQAAYIAVSEETASEDPINTISLAGALREASHEYDPQLKRISINNGESVHYHREHKKYEDKLFWQTGIVYELGILSNRTEFIDSFTLLGYYNLIEAYEKDLQNYKKED